jgi:biopolymer transport protein ExbD
MVTPTELLVQGRAIATVKDIDAQPGLIIEPLRAALKQQTDRLLRATAQADVAAREITVLGDKAVPYRVLKKVLATSTDADYGKLSLAVLQKEEAMNMAPTQ